MRRLTLEIPDAPVAKGRARVTFKNGKAHAYTPSKTVKAEWHIQQWTRATMRRQRLAPFTGALRLIVRAYVPAPKSLRKKDIGVLRPAKRPDASNYLKTVEDGLGKAGIWTDDGQVVEVIAEKYYAWDNQPHWVVIIEELETT